MRTLVIICLITMTAISSGFSIYLSQGLPGIHDVALKEAQNQAAIMLLFWSMLCLALLIGYIVNPLEERDENPRVRDGERLIKQAFRKHYQTKNYE